MRTVPKRKFAIARVLIGTLLLFCALTFYYLAVIRIDYRKTTLLDLHPVDAAEYFADAKALLNNNAAGEQPRIARKSSLLQTKIPLPIEISAPGELSARQGNFAESRGKFPSKRRR